MARELQQMRQSGAIPVWVEHAFAMDLHGREATTDCSLPAPPVLFRGVVDRVDRDDSGFVLREFKSNQRHRSFVSAVQCYAVHPVRLQLLPPGSSPWCGTTGILQVGCQQQRAVDPLRVGCA